MLAWSKLRGFFGSPVAKASMVIPVAGYLIIYNDQISTLLSFRELTKEGAAESEASSMWRLYCLYFGGMLVGLGSVLFHLMCPAWHKVSTDRNVLYENLARQSPAGAYRFLLDDVAESDRTRAWVEREGEDISLNQIALELDSGLDKAKSFSAFADENWEAMIVVFHAYLEALDQKRTIIRWVCAALGGLGVALLALPSMQLFADVVQAALSGLAKP